MTHNITNALASIWNNKIRSLLTVLGVIIGVTSVTTLVSLGEGLKQDVAASIQGLGTNIVTIVSGKIDTTSGNSAGTNPANFTSGDILTVNDVSSIKNVDGVEAVSPISLVAGTMKAGDKQAAPTVFGTYPNILSILNILTLEQGRSLDSMSGNVVILGPTIKEALFGDTNAIGKTVTLGKQDLEVIGTLGKGKSTSIFGSEFDSVSIIPFDTATTFNKDQVKISRIVTKVSDNADVTTTKESIKNRLLENHEGTEDFTVLSQDDLLGLFNTFLNLATTMVSAIAAISLIVGGIGIMNIMLVTVTERTKEIGLRKAVGATRTAILVQFLTEAVVITLLGSIIGLALSIGIGQIIAAQTALKPVITLGVVGTAVGIAVVIGVIFGLWPALRAARKDPIEALRYE